MGLQQESAELGGPKQESAEPRVEQLTGPDLTGAQLQDADLSGADLVDVWGLTWSQVQEALNADLAKLPPSLRPIAARRDWAAPTDSTTDTPTKPSSESGDE